jgi:hypothetical protein
VQSATAPGGTLITAAQAADVQRRAYAPTPYAPTPSLEPIAQDPNAAILAQLNNGTWSGMMNARTMAKRLDADRAAAVAAQGAETNRLGTLASAEIGRTNAAVNARNADTSAFRAGTDARLADSSIAKTGAGIEHTKAVTANEVQRGKAGAIELADREEMDRLRRAAVAGDQKAAERYRAVNAAKAGKNPEEEVNQRLLDAYIKSTGEWSKDPNNMGKPAPTFADFVRSLPPNMFPNAQAAAGGQPLPAGAVRQVGTSGGKPVYQMRDGKQMVAN